MVAAQHSERPETEEEAIPVIGIDDAFVDNTDEQEESRTELTALNMKDKKRWAVNPTPVPKKGVDAQEYATRQALKWIRWLGYKDISVRSDGEPAIVKVVDHVAQHRGEGTRTAPERTPTADSKSNGLIENSNRVVESQTRTRLHALGRNLGQRVPGDWDIYPWAIIHAGTLINRFHVQRGRDGKTPHDIMNGRKSQCEMLEFCEAIQFIPVNSYKDVPKAEPRALNGIWLGVDYETDEHVVGTANGIFTSRTVRRKPAADRWVIEDVKSTRGVPRMPYAYTKDETLVPTPEPPISERSHCR